jgi:hypothetical protein
MKYLLYCIFRNPGDTVSGSTMKPDGCRPEPVAGVGGRPVFLISCKGLGAVVSETPLFCGNETRSLLSPDISRILEYEKVVESFHNDSTVIPMRYGSLFENESRIVQHLEERREQYEAMLRELDNCVEMGIRVLIPSLEGGNGEKESPVTRFAILDSNTPDSGLRYLKNRMACYARQEQLAEKNRSVIEQCRTAFSGLYVQCRSEDTSAALYQRMLCKPLVSMYFLVPRTQLEPFRSAFRQLCSTRSAKLLLSGPWPPYNFVTSSS